MDATANTTPTRARRRSHRSAAIVGLLLGGALLARAVPQLVAAGLGLEARAVLWDLEMAPQPPATERVAAAAAGLAAADVWLADGQARIDRGFLLLRQAEAGDPPRLTAEAEAATASGLALSPGQPSAWARLASLRLARGDHQGAAAALRLSLLSGAVVPALMTWRLDLGLDLRPHLDAEMMALLERQVRLTWVLRPEHVARLTMRDAELVRQALGARSQQDVDNYRRANRRDY